jgi:DNA-binding response OmpR family regulator
MAPSTDNTDMGGIPFKILIVDDDEDDRIILDEAFTEMGYAAEVKKFITRDALFNYLDHIDVALMPSVIVLDYVLGRVTALDVLKDLKKIFGIQQFQLLLIPLPYPHLYRRNYLRKVLVQ